MQSTKKSTKKGFTLIELLVVIAIIGILSSIVLIALRGARDKAKDARIIADLSQIRSIAEILYDGDYDAVVVGQADIAKISADITVQGGGLTINQNELNDDYCAFSALNESGYYCVDSTGIAKETATNPNTATYCNDTTWVCP